ncbi:hypothetical protein EJ05DRAFT_506654 [Pseudovirgaria hyperparasitica]|uniref:DUF1996 domain-containing protein n=1 Tax=Pseudovirgaria hyperparasitica TaxID=470096 RepID=A0A6A6WLB8_9PEZI|nr:uncharacterized protein EJ05DRAFT_506654 [Pseudovirgaria hyperparasitica]KAF2763010.1 hypothetical protein EJ05DRAFT_506654 [Pseudovirgaria hyperparasitica]
MYSSISLASLLALLVSLVPYIAAQDTLFTVNCAPLTTQRSDPILVPGEASSHVHTIIGGTAFARTETNEDAVRAAGTTCDKSLDNSNYWIPQLYHQGEGGQFELVPMATASVYYLNRACDYAKDRTGCDYTQYARAPPKGLRMIAGDLKRRTYNDSDFRERAMSHVCLRANGQEDLHIADLPKEQCTRIRSQVFFPSCWDGENLDSKDHKSHMAYPALGDYNIGVCPESHPVGIFSVFFEFFYDTNAVRDFNRYVYAMGDTTGYGLHGDFINGWTDQEKLQKAMSTCTGSDGINSAGCSLKVNGETGQATRKDPETPAPDEDVGLDGPIKALPGDNPVSISSSPRHAGDWRRHTRHTRRSYNQR